MSDPVKEKENDDGFVQRMLNSILTTLQVRVSHVHVRYEDPGMGTPEQQRNLNSLSYCPPFSAGIVIDSLEGISTDSSWNPSETSTSLAEALLHKLVRLASLSLYIDIDDKSVLRKCGVTDPSSRNNPDFAAFTTMMSETAALRCDGQPHHYVLEPTGGSLKIALNRKFDNFANPKVQATLTLQRINLLVQPLQCHSLLFWLSRVESASTSLRYLKGKPKKRPTEAPREWWKYAIDCVLEPIRKQNASISAAACDARRIRREEYVPIYTKFTLRPNSLSSTEKSAIDRLERGSTFEEIMYFRALAEIEAKSASAQQKAADASKSKGIGSWLGSFVWGSSTVATPEPASSTSSTTTTTDIGLWDSLKVSNEERDAFYEVINFENPPSFSKSKPDDYTEFIIQWQNEAGQVTLFNEDLQPLVAIGFHHLNAGVVVSPKSTSVSLTLQSLNANDLISTDSLYPRLLYPQQKSEETLLTFNLIYRSLSAKSDEGSDKTSTESDFDVSLSLQRLNLVINMDLAQTVTTAFKKQINSITQSSAPPTDSSSPEFEQGSYWNPNSWAASEKRNQQLLSLASMNKSVNLDITVSAPNIIIPRKCSTDDAPTLVLALGTFKLRTDASSTSSIISPENTHHIALTSQPELKKEYYTLHKLEISDIHAVVTNTDRCRNLADINLFTEEEQLFSPITASVSIAACKIASESLAKLRISCFTTPLHLRLTSTQLQTMVRLIIFVVEKASELFVFEDSPTELERRVMSSKIPRIKDSGWSGAVSFAEAMVGASSEPKPASFGTGLSLEISAPDLKATFILDSPNQKPQNRFDLELSSLGYAMETQSNSFSMKAVLGALRLVGCPPSNPANQILLLNSTLSESLSSPTNFEEALIGIHLIHIKSRDPSYRDVDNECIFTFRQVYAQMHAPLIRGMMIYIRTVMDIGGVSSAPKIPESPSVSVHALEHRTPSTPSNPRYASFSSTGSSRVEFRLRFKCEAIQIVMFDLDGLHLSECSLLSAEATFSILAAKGWLMNASIGNFVILDSSPSTSSVSTAGAKRRLLSLDKPNSTNLNLTFIPSEHLDLSKRFDPDIIKVGLELSSLRVQLNPKWLFNTFLSLDELARAFAEVAPRSPAPQTPFSPSSRSAPKDVSIVLLDIEVSDSRIFMPEDISSNTFAVVDVGTAHITSSTEDVTSQLPSASPISRGDLKLKETFKIALKHSDMYIGALESNTSHHPILKDSQFQLSVSSTYEPGTDKPREDSEIWLTSEALKLVLTTEHAHILLRAVQHNLYYMPTDKELSRRLSQATLAEELALALNPSLYELSDTTRPRVNSSFNVGLGALQIEISDSLDINTSMIEKRRLLGLEVRDLECRSRMLSDDSVKVDFSAGKLSALDLRDISTLPSIHPLYDRPELDNEDNRLFIFPTLSSDPQLAGSFTTMPSKNQMNVSIALKDFQLLPEATIVQRLLNVANPISENVMAMLGRREAIQTLTMAPKQKERFLKLKAHPDTSASYSVTLTHPEILLVARTENGLKFSAMSPECIDVSFSQAPSNSLTQITFKNLSASFGSTNETQRAKLFQLSKPTVLDDVDASTDAPLAFVRQYDILSPVSLEATLLITPHEHQYAVHFRNQVRICSSYSDYLDFMDLIGPFLAVDDRNSVEAESSESTEPVFQLPEVPLGYDPAPIRFYPPASNNSSTGSLLSIAGSSTVGTGVAAQSDKVSASPTSVQELDMEEDDLYNRIMNAANNAEENWFEQHVRVQKAIEATSSASSSGASIGPLTPMQVLNHLNPALPPSVASSLPSTSTPIGQPLHVSSNPDADNLELPGALNSSLGSPRLSNLPIYVPKRLSIGSLKMELMVMDNRQSDLGLIRAKIDVVTLRLHNWDAEEFKKTAQRSDSALVPLSSTTPPPPPPMRTAQFEARIEADCFAPLVSAWEPLVCPYRFEIIINGRDLRIIAASALNLVITENFLLNWKRILAVLDTEQYESGLKNSQNYAQMVTSTPDRMRSQHLHYINNCTGQHLQYELIEDTTKQRSPSRILAPGSEEALVLPVEWATIASQAPLSKTHRADIANHQIRFNLSVRIASHDLNNINVNRVGCRVHQLDELRSVVVDVQYQQGVKVITLKSRISLHNNTGIPLVVGLELGSVTVDRASQLPKAFNPITSLFSRKSTSSTSADDSDQNNTGSQAGNTGFGSGTMNGAVSQVTSGGRVTTISQICVVEPYSWFHVPIDIIHDGVLRFRPGATGEFVSFNDAQKAQQMDTDYAYQWGNYRCELRKMVAHRPRYMVCMPRPTSDVVGVDTSSSSASLINPFQYSTGVCRVATKSSIIAGSDEFVLHFQPPLVIENLLPERAEFLIHETDPIAGASKSRSSSKRKGPDPDMPLLPTVGRIESGQRIPLHNLSINRRILMGLCTEGFEWSPEQLIRYPEPNGPRYYAPGEEPPFGTPELPAFLDLPETKKKGASGPIETAKRSTRVELENQMTQLGTRLVTFYAKYWIVNKTGLPLLTASDARDPSTIGAGMLSQFEQPSKAASPLTTQASPTKLDSSTSSLLGLASPAPRPSQDSNSRLALSTLFDSTFSSGCVEAPKPTVTNNPFSNRSSMMFTPSPAKANISSAPSTHRPMMYNPGGGVDNDRICVKVLGSKWSIPLPLENAANGLSRITVKGEDVAHVDTGSALKIGILGGNTKLRKFFDLSLSIGPAADRFWRTTVLTFCPRYMFTNKLSVPILLRCSKQSSPNSSPSLASDNDSRSHSSPTSSTGKSVHTEGIIMPGETAPWHWIGASGGDRLANEAIEMRLDLPGCSWSGPMLLETRVMTTVAMFNPDDGSRIFVRLLPRMHTSTGITTIIFKQEDLQNPLFKIVNRTSQSITVRQKGFASIPSASSKNAPSPAHSAALDTVPALDSRIWGWYSQSAIENGLEIAFINGNRLPKSFSLTKVRTYPNAMARVGNMEFEVSLSVSTDRTTRILVIEPATSLRNRVPASSAAFDRRATSSPSSGVQQRVQTRTQHGRETSINPVPMRPTTMTGEPLAITDGGDGVDLTASSGSGGSGGSSGSSSDFSLLSDSFADVPDNPELDIYEWKIGLALHSISVSLINGEPEEVLFGVVSHIGLEYIIFPKRWTLEVQIGDLQVDNQDPMTFYPVAIASAGTKPRYWLQFSLIRSTEYPDIICQPLVSLLVKETHVRVDEVLILKLLDLYTARRWRDVTQRSATPASLASSTASLSASTASASALPSATNPGPSPSSLAVGSASNTTEKLLFSNENIQMLGLDEDESKMVYTEFALLNPIHILLSFQFTQRTTDDARERALKEQRALKLSRYDPESWRGFGVPREFPALEAFLRNPLTGIFTFERAPIFFSCLLVEHSFVSYNVMYDTVVNHYASQAVKFVMTVGGSLDVAGDPISLAYNLGTGVRDLFYEPAKGIAISPLAFGQGLGRGGAQFAKKSLYGIFNSLNKGFHTLGTAAAYASFDSDYQAKRAQRKQREQPKNVAYGVGQGAFEFSKGLFDGLTGLVVQPVMGAQKDGAAGFFKGMGKGAAGLVVKPVVGALDLVQRTAEGIKNTASDLVQSQRCRWPLYISEDGIICTYARAPALAMQIIHSIKNEEYAHELFCGYFKCTTAPDSRPDSLLGTLLIATSQQLVFVSTTKNTSETKGMLIPPAQMPNVDARWQIPLSALKSTDYIVDQSTRNMGQFIFIRSDRKEKHIIRLDGTLDRFQELAAWVKMLKSRHKLLAEFFNQALREEDENTR